MQQQNPEESKVTEQEVDQIETLTITRGEYSALEQIYGLESSVHFMVMLARPDENGNFELKGTQSTFDALQTDLAEEIYSELSPKSRLSKLRKLYRRLQPDGEF